MEYISLNETGTACTCGRPPAVNVDAELVHGFHPDKVTEPRGIPYVEQATFQLRAEADLNTKTRCKNEGLAVRRSVRSDSNEQPEHLSPPHPLRHD